MIAGKNMLTSAALLAAFAVVGTAIVAFTYEKTLSRVEQNRRDFTLARLHELITPELHDNDLNQDTILVNDPLLGAKHEVMVYRARKNNQPVAAIIQSVAPDGYSGKIEMLVAIHYDGKLAGVRVVSHRETPGLGDAIDARKTDWILQFAGLSLHKPESSRWLTRRDGGQFDEITSATITSRAVIKCVYNTLQYFKSHRDILFSEVRQ